MWSRLARKNFKTVIHHFFTTVQATQRRAVEWVQLHADQEPIELGCVTAGRPAESLTPESVTDLVVELAGNSLRFLSTVTASTIAPRFSPNRQAPRGMKCMDEP